MREIKFRAWDKKFKQWVHLTADSGKPLGTELNSFIAESQKDCILMQYTGLHDCKGAEIYEGDILKCRDTNYSVKWDEDRFGFSIIGQPKGFSHYQAFSSKDQVKRDAEVIGNIHQHPDLLRKD